MRRFSPKRQSIESRMKQVYRELDEEIGQCACGMRAYDHSHNYPRHPFTWLIDDKRNITLLCRHHHENFENNRIWEVPDGWKIMSEMAKLMLEEQDERRQETMVAHFVGKLIRAKYAMDSEHRPYPEWFIEFLTVFEL